MPLTRVSDARVHAAVAGTLFGALAATGPVVASCVEDGTCVVVERQSFPTSDWQATCHVEVIPVSVGESVVTGACGTTSAGGQLPDFEVSGVGIRRTTFLFPALGIDDANFARDHWVFVAHVLVDGTVWNPATQGPLAGLLYRETRSMNQFIANFPALRQNGVVFASANVPATGPGPGSFEVGESGCLDATDFVSEAGTHPNFSASGAPIELGYERSVRGNPRNVASSASEDQDDNLRYVLFTAANPGCLDPPPVSPPQPGLEVTKTTNPPDYQWSFDAIVPYELTVTNAGAIAASSVVLGDFVPLKTTYQPDASATAWVCDPGPGEGSLCTVDVGDLAPGASVTVDFPVLVNEGTPDSWELFNEAFVDSFAGSAQPVTTRGLRGRTETSRSPPSRSAAGIAAGSLEPRSSFGGSSWWVTLVKGVILCCFQYGFGAANDLCVEEEEISIPFVDGRTRSGSSVGRQTLSPPADTAFDVPVLYRLRDRIFRRTPGGRRATDLSVAHIADIGETSDSSPDAHARALAWYLGWQPLLRQLIAGRGDTVTVTAGHTQLLVDYVASLKAFAATPALLDALELEETRLDIPSWVGLDMNQWLDAINVLSCEPSDTVLCLQGGRFRVEAEWLTEQGEQGHGRAVQLTPDTGYFWFFDPANVEVVTKAVSGCGFPGGHPLRNFWVFAAGLTDVDVLLSVTDTDTGETQRYHNPQKTEFLPIQDTGAFPTCDAPALPRSEHLLASYDLPYPPIPRRAAPDRGMIERALSFARGLLGLTSDASTGAPVRRAASVCTEDASTLCLNEDRFKVTAQWRTVGGDSGAGQAIELTDNTGYFWFFDDANVEVVVKTLDACGFAAGSPLRNFWVFAAGLTDVEVDLRVEDTLTGDVKVYHNDQKTQFDPVQDTGAFPTCDAI